jgi:hypothetical protein
MVCRLPCYGTVRLSIRHDWRKTTRKISYHSQARTSSKFIERFGVITLLPTSTTAMISSRTLLLAVGVCTSSVLNGAQLVSPPMRTVQVGKPIVSPKAFSVSRRLRSQVVRPASERTLERTTHHFTLDHSNHQFINGLSLPCGGKVSTVEIE